MENIIIFKTDRVGDLIHLSGFTRNEKLQVAKEYLLDSIYANYNMTNISFKDDAIYYLIDTYSKEEGVRELKRKLEDVISKINLLTMVDSASCNLPRISIKFPLKITINLIKKILKNQTQATSK